MTPSDLVEYATPRKIATLFGLSRSSVFERIAAGDFVAVKLGPRKTLVEMASVRAYLASRPKAGGTAAQAKKQVRTGTRAEPVRTQPARTKPATPTDNRTAIRASSVVVEALCRVAPQESR